MSDIVTYLPPIIKRMVLIEKKSQSAKSFFLNYIQGLEVKIDKDDYPDYVFYFKNGDCLFKYDGKKGYFYCQYNEFWSVFLREYHMDNQQLQAFIKNEVEEHFKIKVTTPRNWLGNSSVWVEEYFKFKITTPILFQLF